MTWLKESVTVKLAFIGFLTLILLIPSSMISNLVQERAARQAEAMDNISDQWSGKQLIQGPVLVIPYKHTSKESDNNGKLVDKEVTDQLFILPEVLKINADISTRTLHRGIFQSVVYNSKIAVNGCFSKVDLAKAGLSGDQLQWDKARVAFSISDLKGLQTNPIITAGGLHATADPALNERGFFSDGLQAALDLTPYKEQTIPFSFQLDLKGSQELHFLNLGKTTEVKAAGDWGSPSFDGRYSPDERVVKDKGFSAQWKMLYYNRPFPQQWTGNDTLLNSMSKSEIATFGVKLRCR